jgi:hypothetical protein
VDFKEREVDFREAERRYAELERQRETGAIDERQFDAQRRRLMVQDDAGRWWIRSRETGEWLFHDGDTWVRGTPPGYREAAPERAPVGPQTPPPPSRRDGAGDGGNGRRRIPLWISVVGLGAIVLLGLVVIVGPLMPYLRGELAFFGQGDPASSGQGEPMAVEQGESAPSGVAFDAVFVHRATPDNITANSTYLDEDLINDNPNAIVYVTPNWNPGGEGDTYNDHAIGVWFDDKRQRWAIFNQDREPMPEGAAFNVAVLAQPPG